MKSYTKYIALSILSAILSTTATAKEGAIQCANLIYAGTKTSECFSDEFLTTVQQKTSISTERRFKAVKMSSNELFKFPFVMMTGTGDFSLTSKERENLKKYLNNGGFLLASPSCSDEAWAGAFTREIKRIFKDEKLTNIQQDHAIFKTIFTIKELKCKSGKTTNLQGITFNDKLVVCYTPDGLNDTSNTEGCCC
jgi:hypothetical protein